MEYSDQARGTAPRTIIRALLGFCVAMLAAGLTGCPGVPISGNADSTTAGSATAAQAPVTPAPVAAPSTPATPGTATLSWQAPTENQDGTPLEGLAGFYIHFGPSAEELSQLIEVRDAASTTYEINGLISGTYYFAVSAYNVFGIEGPLSNITRKSL